MNNSMLKRRLSNLSFKYYIVDILIIGISFVLILWIKPASIEFYFPLYIKPLLLFISIWILVSRFHGKYKMFEDKSLNDINIILTFSNVTVLAITTSLLYLFNRFGYSRLIVFGTILIATIIEFLSSYLYFSFINARALEDELADNEKLKSSESGFHGVKTNLSKEEMKSLIEMHTNEEVYQFISNNLKGKDFIINSDNDKLTIEQLIYTPPTDIIDLFKLNNIYGITKYFFLLNSILPSDGLYIGRFETIESRKSRIINRLPFPVNRINYFVDFIFKRVFPKLLFTRGIYFFFFKNKVRVLTKAEIFGRLYACGFEIVEEQISNDELFFVSRKITSPLVSKNPSYGLLIALKRHGKDGKLFNVFKLRTMHAYSEFLQEYIYIKHNLQEGGKFKNDFRITVAGKLLRRFWIDELPMIINLIRGEMKIFGVRPLSSHYFSLYSEELRKKRTKYKPGLIPPFYVDLPKTFEEIMESESRYLDSYEKSPFKTDWKYFWKAIYNIFVKNVRGK